MSKHVDLSNQQFEMLKVLEQVGKNERGEKLWKCLCDCGKVTYATTGKLTTGKRKSCGCTRIRNDITGKRYEKLLAIKDTGKKKESGHIWLCECECGNRVEVSVGELNHGDRTSCGCANSDRRKDITTKSYGRLTAIERTEKKKNRVYLWKCECECGKQVEVSVYDLERENVRSCGCMYHESLKNLYVEGVNIPKLLNPQLRSTNRSGVTGVYWNASKGRWMAEIGFQGKRYRLGGYTEFSDAVEARKTAEKKLHGEFLELYENEYNKKMLPE